VPSLATAARARVRARWSGATLRMLHRWQLFDQSARRSNCDRLCAPGAQIALAGVAPMLRNRRIATPLELGGEHQPAFREIARDGRAQDFDFATIECLAGMLAPIE